MCRFGKIHASHRLESDTLDRRGGATQILSIHMENDGRGKTEMSGGVINKILSRNDIKGNLMSMGNLCLLNDITEFGLLFV